MRHTPLFQGSYDDTRAARHEARRRWSDLDRVEPTKVTFQELLAAHASIHRVAEQISGTSTCAGQRATHYYALYEESKGNLMFPLIASHGSLWGVRHTLRLQRLLERAKPLSRHGRIDRWIEALDAVRDVNRKVFVEIYTTFYFTRFYGTHPHASEIIHPDVLPLYNAVHRAIADEVQLSEVRRREIYYAIFLHEQEHIVDPGVNEAAQAAGSRLLLEAFKRVRPRFAYFPPGERLYFTDFTDVEQRNREGLRALAFAEQVGPARVFEALSEY
ncbi:MAG: hypothetical protein EA397_12515 [Deltaproteobacteria bacterium]|nr:MAG: hypothetical protein EA397_12515 [Deltaproteobacteria bacterium]